jgi:hypothetical protein
VTTSSRFANVVTIAVTVVELAIAAAIVHVLPEYVDVGSLTASLPI